MAHGIGARIKYIRENILKMNQEQLARFFDLKQSALSSIEINRVDASLYMILVLALSCNISSMWILKGTGEKPVRNDKKIDINKAKDDAQQILDKVTSRMKEARDKAGLSQEQIARMLGVGQSNISDIERNRVSISAKTFLLYLKAVEVNDIDGFLDLSQNDKQLNQFDQIDLSDITDDQKQILHNLISEFRRLNKEASH